MTGHLGEADVARMRRSGVGALAVDEGLALLDRALLSGEPHVVAAKLDAAALRGAMVHPLLRDLVAGGDRPRAPLVSLETRLEGVPAADREHVVLDLVRGQVAGVLGHAALDGVDPRRPFKELGFDSLAAVELKNRLARVTGVRVPATAVFDHPTPQALAAWLLEQAQPPAPAAVADDEVRRALAALPVERLRSAGLLDRLLELAAEPEPAPAPAAPPADAHAAEDEDIDALDLAALIEKGLESDR
jgi:acyl carrier protein